MGRTLFLGDSHSSGFYIDRITSTWQKATKFWSKNNYAEIYSEIHNKPVVIYAMPGASNKKYPVWLRAMFDRYSDIDEVFIQSVYWSRCMLAASKNLDSGDGIKANHFSIGPNPQPFAPTDTPLIERWEDTPLAGNYIEMPITLRPSLCPEYKGFDHSEINSLMPTTMTESYAYTRFWHENVTHLQYRDYCGDLYIIDNICKEYGIKWHLWGMTNRVDMPNNINFYGKIQNCIRSTISAQQFIKNTHKIDIDKMKIDGDHYSYAVHEIIAKEYIPYVKELDKT
jgi:hypothetical protein